ncbi:MAG: ABC transporter substrate-binding protein [Bacteroidales bacterium]|nr:ABC transporter substrate-binding protein [Bacteroidales bacterium]
MKLLKDLWLAVSLILLTSAVLLLSDLGQRQMRQPQRKTDLPQIAILQISSTTLLDAHVAGVISGLQEKGYYAADGRNVRRFNAHGDYATAVTISRELANGPYDMVITSSTVALQAFATANRSTQKLHVFGAVTDPYGTGVGITGPEPHEHPPYMAGIGTFQPVRQSFILARELNPALRRVGVVWNPGEQCSEACMLEARQISKELGIELVEAIAVNTNEVSEAVRSLTGQRVEAIWVGGDTVAMSSIHLIINIATQAGIPVFTNDHLDALVGALFGLGANYFTVGEYTARMAVEILEGADPASYRIDNVVPERFRLNREVLARLDECWHINTTIQALLDEQVSDLSRIALIRLVENPALDMAVEGVGVGLMEGGLRSGDDYIMKTWSAQGDMAQLPQIVEAAVRENPDLIITVTTPALIATAQRVKDIPVVFTVASDPVKLGLYEAGRRPGNLCGIYDDPPLDRLLEMAREYVKDLSSVGIVYDAAEMNSLISVEKLRIAGKQQEVRVIEATVSSTSELPMATQSLIQRGAQAILLSADNTATTGFPAIARVASSADIPVFTTETGMVKYGAAGAVGDNYFEWGREAGILAAQVISGISPAVLPVRATSVYETIRPGETAVRHQPWRLRLVHYQENEFSERCEEGLLDGLNKAGFIEGRDYHLRIYNAQGDMSTLSGIMQTIRTDRVDLLMVISTPALQAALRQAGSDTRIVFTGVGDGVQAGAGKSETDHLPNVTGVSTRSDFAQMVDVIRQTLPNAKRVGTLFTPAEINSVLYKNWFAEALAEYGMELVAVPVTMSSDVPQSASELLRQDIQVLAQVVDNLTRPGFGLIARRAAENNIPVYVFDSDQMKDGGVIAVACDYYQAGIEAAAKAVRVLNGESPALIPFSNVQTVRLIINPALTSKHNINIPEELYQRAEIFK